MTLKLTCIAASSAKHSGAVHKKRQPWNGGFRYWNRELSTDFPAQKRGGYLLIWGEAELEVALCLTIAPYLPMVIYDFMNSHNAHSRA